MSKSPVRCNSKRCLIFQGTCFNSSRNLQEHKQKKQTKERKRNPPETPTKEPGKRNSMATKLSKKFDKKKGYRFTLLSRSQQDPLYHEGGSEQVLHPLDEKTAKAMEEGMFQEDTTSFIPTGMSSANPPPGIHEYREVDEFGLPIDDYDYHQHLSTANDGGVFIGRDGIEITGPLQFDASPSSAIPIPANVFASDEVLERRADLEAILLAPELMDEDMKAQLNEVGFFVK